MNKNSARYYGLEIPDAMYVQEFPVEVKIESVDTLKLTMQNGTNSLSKKCVVAVEIFPVDEQALVQSGRPNISNEQFRNLALYLDDDTNTQIAQAVPSASFYTAQNNGILKLLTYANINWSMSYIQFAPGTVLTVGTSVILNVHYLEFIASPKTAGVLQAISQGWPVAKLKALFS